MTKLNRTTKRAQGFIYAYCRSDCHSIYQAYEYPSQKKITSFETIRMRCFDDGGEDLRVISSGCQFYSTGYVLGDDLIIDTYAETYIIPDAFKLLI